MVPGESLWPSSGKVSTWRTGIVSSPGACTLMWWFPTRTRIAEGGIFGGTRDKQEAEVTTKRPRRRTPLHLKTGINTCHGKTSFGVSTLLRSTRFRKFKDFCFGKAWMFFFLFHPEPSTHEKTQIVTNPHKMYQDVWLMATLGRDCVQNSLEGC